LLNAIGRVSYGMYLYHALLVSVMDRMMMRFAIPKHSLRGVACFAVLVLVTWCISAVSFRFVQQPFLRLKQRRRAPALVPAG
jgi:peptidoglycan/LPS O-acetylase OafA/YrhL